MQSISRSGKSFQKPFKDSMEFAEDNAMQNSKLVFAPRKLSNSKDLVFDRNEEGTKNEDKTNEFTEKRNCEIISSGQTTEERKPHIFFNTSSGSIDRETMKSAKFRSQRKSSRSSEKKTRRPMEQNHKQEKREAEEKIEEQEDDQDEEIVNKSDEQFLETLKDKRRLNFFRTSFSQCSNPYDLNEEMSRASGNIFKGRQTSSESYLNKARRPDSPSLDLQKNSKLLKKEFEHNTQKFKSHKNLDSNRLHSSEHLSDAEKKLTNFKISREAGKHVCVCGASAYYERENISMAQERLRLKHESQRLQSEVANLRDSRERINIRLVDIENLEQKLHAHSEMLAEKEKMIEKELTYVSEQAMKIKQQNQELEDKEQFLINQEKTLEIQRRKLEREKAEVQRLVEKSHEESRRANELSAQANQSEARLAELKEKLSEELLDVEATRQKILSVAAEQENMRRCIQDETASIAREKTKLRRWEEELNSQDLYLIEQKQDIDGLRLVNNKTKEVLDLKEEELEKREKKLQEQQKELNDIKKELFKQQDQFEISQRNAQASFESSVQKQKKELESRGEVLEAQLKQLEKREQELKTALKELEEKEQKFKKLQEAVSATQKHCDDQQNQFELEKKEFEKEQQKFEKEVASFNEKKLQLEQTKLEAEKTKQEVNLFKQALTEEIQKTKEKTKNLHVLEEKLKSQESLLRQRETALTSQEAQSEWHQSVLKDVIDAKDRLNLQLKDFELEKHTFATKCTVLNDHHERIRQYLLLREKTLASLEVKLNQRAKDVQRKEHLFEQRFQKESPEVRKKLFSIPETNHKPVSSSATCSRVSLKSAAKSPLNNYTLPNFPQYFRSVSQKDLSSHLLAEEATGDIPSLLNSKNRYGNQFCDSADEKQGSSEIKKLIKHKKKKHSAVPSLKQVKKTFEADFHTDSKTEDLNITKKLSEVQIVKSQDSVNMMSKIVQKKLSDNSIKLSSSVSSFLEDSPLVKTKKLDEPDSEKSAPTTLQYDTKSLNDYFSTTENERFQHETSSVSLQESEKNLNVDDLVSESQFFCVKKFRELMAENST